MTGDIGSGKSTLVDAVTTLLVPPENRIQQGRGSRQQGAFPPLLRSRVLQDGTK